MEAHGAATRMNVKAEANTGKISFPVTGMTCAACQARVQRALTAVPGVTDASVNLLTKSAAVDYDPSSVTPQRLIEAVRATGYDAELSSDHHHEHLAVDFAADDDESREARDLTVKATVSVIAGLLAMLFSMLFMGNSSINYVLLVVTSGILAWAGRDIYRRAWKALRHRSTDMNTLVRLSVRLLGSCDRGAESLRAEWNRARCLLRGRRIHHRARTCRPRDRSPRNAKDLGGAPKARHSSAIDSSGGAGQRLDREAVVAGRVGRHCRSSTR